MSFYDEVLRELVVALGAAMFIGNLVALFRRRSAVTRAVPAGARSLKAKGASREARPTGELDQAPMARTLVYVTLGFLMMVAGIAAIVAA